MAGKRVLDWAENDEGSQLASWLARGPPNWQMLSLEGNALVDDVFRKAIGFPFEKQWPYVMAKLLEVENAGHGECFDTAVRDTLYIRLGCPPNNGHYPDIADGESVKAWLLEEYGESDSGDEM